MVRVSYRTAAMALILLAAIAPVSAKDEEAGGYYWSIKHPDFGSRPEDGKHPEEGYYGSIKRNQEKENADQFANFKKGEGYYGPVNSPETANKAADGTTTPAAADAPAAQTGTAASSPITATTSDPAPVTPADISKELSTLLTAPGTPPAAPGTASGASASAPPAAGATPAPAPIGEAAVKLPALPGHASIAHPNNSFEQGRFAYDQRAYHQAEECFENCVKSDPMSQQAHLWLGLTKYHLYDYDGAKDELNLAFRLNPFTEEGRQARETLLSVAQTIQKLNSEPVDPPWLVQQTLRITARQARGLQAQRIAEGNQTSAWRAASAQRTASRLTGETNWYLQGFTNYNNNWGAQQEISNANYIRTHYIMTDGQVQGAMARKDGIDRANNIQQSVNGFFDLLGQKPHDGTPRVRAFGSNLYVRYYGKESVDGPPTVAPADPPMKAVTMHYNR